MKAIPSQLPHICRPKALLAFALVVTRLASASELKPQRESDRLALENITRAMLDAFDKQDAAALAANWTDEGEFVHNDEQPIRGRAAIEKGYAEFFKSLNGHPKLEIQSNALRFPSADTAVTETTLRLKNEDGEIVASGWQNTILIREAGQWKILIVRERDRDTGLDIKLNDLAWLLGTWQATNDNRELTMTYDWDENHAFIRGKFTVRDSRTVIESGTQYIGKDNSKGTIRSWVFQADGGFSDELWTREGRKWSVEVHGVRADGTVLTATNIYLHLDSNTLSWQAVNQALNGTPVPDTEPIKVVRQKPAK